MDKPNMLSHWAAAEKALTEAGKAGIAAATREAWARVARAELQACYILLMYPDVSFGALP